MERAQSEKLIADGCWREHEWYGWFQPVETIPNEVCSNVGAGDERGRVRLPGQTGQVYTPLRLFPRAKEEIGTKTGLSRCLSRCPLRQKSIAPRYHWLKSFGTSQACQQAYTWKRKAHEAEYQGDRDVHPKGGRGPWVCLRHQWQGTGGQGAKPDLARSGAAFPALLQIPDEIMTLILAKSWRDIRRRQSLELDTTEKLPTARA